MNLEKVVLLAASALFAISVINVIAGNWASAITGFVVSLIVLAVITSPE